MTGTMTGTTMTGTMTTGTTDRVGRRRATDPSGRQACGARSRNRTNSAVMSELSRSGRSSVTVG